MGSSGEGDIDCSVGTIVWVRRRNGSWWPGKILGPEELSASHVMSPRSGTPVKLLGREDASVDWYNLEKSKRVKAFRCGDFDDCIERAESSLGVPSKKREKYARREDAILHALELEKEMLGDKHDKSGITSDCRSRKLSDANREEFIISSETLGNENGKLRNFKSHEISKSLDLCLKDEVMGEAQLTQQAEEGNQVSYEDEICNVIPRMRGLQDFEHKATPSKRKISSPAVSNGYQKPRKDNLVVSIGGFNMGSSSYANSFLEKRKTLYKGLNEDSPVKRRDRCRPLLQVLKTSAKLPASLSMQTDSGSVFASVPGDEQTRVTCQAKRSKCLYLPPKSSDCLDQKENSSIQVEVSSSQIEANNCHPHPSSLTEGNSSESTEDDKTDSSETDYLESDTEDEMFVASDSAGPLEAEPKTMGISELEVEQGSVSSDGLGERAGDMSPLHTHGAVSGDGGMSEWQLKGKRNIRSFTIRYVDSYDGRGSDVSTHGIYLEEKGSSFSLHPKSDDFGSGFDDLDVIDSYYNTQAVGFSGRGYPLTSKAASRRRSSVGHNIVDLDESAWDNRPVLKNYWEEKHERFNPVFIGRHHLGSRTKSMLIDVDLKVQSSYPKEHVPIVSLMSRFNGKAIIGHPIQIEALEDGLSAGLLPRSDDFGNEAFDNDMNSALTPVWRTARRTANRVRRPHPFSMWDDEDDAEQVPFDKGKKSQFKKLNAGSTSQKASRMRTAPHIPRPPTQRKATRKPPKKASLSSSQKIRTLSSIAVGNKPKHGSRSSYLEGLIKPVSGPTTVACIPVKLVFSRLFEGVVRPPSRVAGHGDTTNGNTGRKPS